MINYKEKYIKYKLKYIELKNKLQEGGTVLPYADGPEKNKIIYEGIFDNDKTYRVKLHALKHVESMGIRYDTDSYPAIMSLVQRALYVGKGLDSTPSLDIFNNYKGYEIKLISKRSDGSLYCIMGTWEYDKKMFTIFTICSCDISGRCIYD